MAAQSTAQRVADAALVDGHGLRDRLCFVVPILMFPLGHTFLWHGGYVTAHASTSKRPATTPSILTFELSSNLGLARSAEAGLAPMDMVGLKLVSARPMGGIWKAGQTAMRRGSGESFGLLPVMTLRALVIWRRWLVTRPLARVTARWAPTTRSAVRRLRTEPRPRQIARYGP
jgi:hypothetical protein